MDDEASQAYPATVNTLLDNALGLLGYYGAFGTNMHHGRSLRPRSCGGRPSSRRRRHAAPGQSPTSSCLDWTDGRNNSTIRALSWNAGTLNFTTTVAAGGHRG